jgi:hypothetical protein
MHTPLAINWEAQEYKIKREALKRSEKLRTATLVEQHAVLLSLRRQELSLLFRQDYEDANKVLAEKGLSIGIERL